MAMEDIRDFWRIVVKDRPTKSTGQFFSSLITKIKEYLPHRTDDTSKTGKQHRRRQMNKGFVSRGKRNGTTMR
jgi:hypothetical protein